MAEKRKQEDERQQLREITVQLDNYDDIFSDFDPRPYNEREVSEDFIKEMQRRYMEDKKGRYEVHFTIPAFARNAEEESMIKRRLREHFSFMVKHEEEIIQAIRFRGYMYIVAGALVLLANVMALYVFEEQSIDYQILSIMLVPAGWYGMFTGIGKVLDEPGDAERKKKVYEKFEKASYLFMSDELE